MDTTSRRAAVLPNRRDRVEHVRLGVATEELRPESEPLLKLQGVVKISHTTINGTPLLNLEGFAPSSQWEELSAGLPPNLKEAS